MFEMTSPARLNVLLGEVQVILISAYSFFRLENTRCLPLNTKILMDFIADDDHIVFHTDVSQPQQLVF